MALTGAANPSLASDTKTLNQSLRNYKVLKSKEALLRIKIGKSNTSLKDKFNREFDALKPKIYDAAQVMESQVAQFERRHGVAKLCAAIAPGMKPMVPTCMKKRK